MNDLGRKFLETIHQGPTSSSRGWCLKQAKGIIFHFMTLAKKGEIGQWKRSEDTGQCLHYASAFLLLLLLFLILIFLFCYLLWGRQQIRSKAYFKSQMKNILCLKYLRCACSSKTLRLVSLWSLRWLRSLEKKKENVQQSLRLYGDRGEILRSLRSLKCGFHVNTTITERFFQRFIWKTALLRVMLNF